MLSCNNVLVTGASNHYISIMHYVFQPHHPESLRRKIKDYYWLHTVLVTVHGFGLFSRVLKCTPHFQIYIMKQILRVINVNGHILGPGSI